MTPWSATQTRKYHTTFAHNGEKAFQSSLVPGLIYAGQVGKNSPGDENCLKVIFCVCGSSAAMLADRSGLQLVPRVHFLFYTETECKNRQVTLGTRVSCLPKNTYLGEQ